MKRGFIASLMITILVSSRLNPTYFVGEYQKLMRPTACSYPVSGEICQRSIFTIEGKRSSNVNGYNLNTIGATSMIDRDGVSLASFKDNVDVFPDNVAIFRLDLI
jgi:hypothetical protein